MKKIQLYRLAFLAMLPALVLTSCRFEDDDYFSESAALRIEHKGEQVKNQLVSAPNGWVMQYFCARDIAVFEGFNLFARFENSNKVTFASDHRFLRNGNAGKYTEASSVYEMRYEDGLVLAFNTWNDVLTPFSDPVYYGSAPDRIVKDGEGMYGDHNFCVEKVSDNEIILRGERRRAEVRLVKADRDWQTYIADTKKLKEKICNNNVTDYYVTNGTQTYYFCNLRNGRFKYTDDLNMMASIKVDSLACCFTPNGFRIESADSIGSNMFHEFTVDDDMTCLKNEDGTVKVIPCWDYYIVNKTAIWNMDPEVFSATQKDLYDKINTAIKTFNSGWSLANIGIGKSTGANFVIGMVLTFYTNTAKTKTNTAGILLDMMRPDYGQMTIEYSADFSSDKNMQSIAKKVAEVETYARSFAETLKGTYTIKPNDYFNPTGADFTATQGGTTFRLQ